MRKTNILAIALLTILSTASLAQESVATALFQTDLPDIEGREAVVLEVEYPPGVASASHRHNAHTFVYVLEGTVVMAVAGGENTDTRCGADVLRDTQRHTFRVAERERYRTGKNTGCLHQAGRRAHDGAGP